MLKFFKRHKILAILLIIVLLWGIVFMCEYRRSSWYSEEQHIKRLNKRVENRYKNWNYLNGEHYESFKIYPLYDENDELKYFLVEFEPFGFTFICIKEYELNTQLIVAFRKSMYKVSLLYRDEYPCCPVVGVPYNDDKPILDENGNRVKLVKSPYYVNGHIKERKYFIRCASGAYYVCAIKQGDEFINVIDGKPVNVNGDSSYHDQAKIFAVFYVGKGVDLW